VAACVLTSIRTLPQGCICNTISIIQAAEWLRNKATHLNSLQRAFTPQKVSPGEPAAPPITGMSARTRWTHVTNARNTTRQHVTSRGSYGHALRTNLHNGVQQGRVREPHDVVDAVYSIRRVPCTRERRWGGGKAVVCSGTSTPLSTRRQSTAHVSVLELQKNLVQITAHATCAHSAFDKTFSMTNAPATPGTAKSKVNYGVKQRAGRHLAGSRARGPGKSRSARCQAVWQRC
jgi:hypothetical protein